MDTMTLAFILGAGLLIIGTIELGMSKKTRTYFKLGGVLLCIIAVASWSGISFGAEEPPPAAVAGEFTVTGSESHSYVTVDNLGQTFTWAVSYNHTTDQIVGASQCTLQFSVDKGLGTIGLVQTSCSVSTIPSVTNSTNGQSYPILSKTNDQYDALWTRADATSHLKSISLTIPEDSDGTTVSLNLTLNSGAIRSMDEFDTCNLSLSIANEVWVVAIMLVDISP